MQQFESICDLDAPRELGYRLFWWKFKLTVKVFLPVSIWLDWRVLPHCLFFKFSSIWGWISYNTIHIYSFHPLQFFSLAFWICFSLNFLAIFPRCYLHGSVSVSNKRRRVGGWSKGSLNYVLVRINKWQKKMEKVMKDRLDQNIYILRKTSPAYWLIWLVNVVYYCILYILVHSGLGVLLMSASIALTFVLVKTRRQRIKGSRIANTWIRILWTTSNSWLPHILCLQTNFGLRLDLC